MPKAKAPVSRSPRGVLTSKPIFTRLFPEEQHLFEARAAKEGRSLSSMARLMIVKGMQADGTQVTRAGPQPQTMFVEGD